MTFGDAEESEGEGTYVVDSLCAFLCDAIYKRYTVSAWICSSRAGVSMKYWKNNVELYSMQLLDSPSDLTFFHIIANRTKRNIDHKRSWLWTTVAVTASLVDGENESILFRVLWALCWRLCAPVS